MNKKLLFGMCMISLVLIISMPTAEAGWFEDTWNWLMTLLGIGEEEAKEKAKELMKDNSKLFIEKNYVSSRVEGNITWVKYEGVIHPSNFPYFVNVSNKLIRRSEAESLKDLYWNGELLFGCEVKDDGINLMDCVDFNSTSRTYKLQRDSLALSNVPLRKYKLALNETNNKIEKVYDESFETTLNFIDNKEQKELILKADIDDIIEFGEFSTLTDIKTNTTYADYNDTRWVSSAPTTNYGISINPAVADGSFPAWIFNTTSALGIKIRILQMYWTIYVYNIAFAGEVSLFQCNELWQEGDKDGTAGNSSHNFANDSDVTGFSGCGRSIGSLVNESQTWTDDTWEPINLTNLTALQEQHDADGYINLVGRPRGSADMAFRPKEQVGFEPSINVTWEVYNTPPSNPNPLLNSTDSSQANQSNEDLACNFLCDDTNIADTLTYDLYWYKDGVFDFNVSFVSCSNPEYVSYVLDSANTTVEDLWMCSVNITDVDGVNSSTMFSNNVTINPFLFNPSVIINSTDGSNYTNQSLWCEFDCRSTDLGDTITYSLEYLENGTDVIYSLLDQSCINPSNNSIELTNGNTTHASYSCNVNLTSTSESFTTLI